MANNGMSALDAIMARRNVRQYEPRPIARSDLDRILDAGRRSPSGKNSQPWDFVVVTDRNSLHRLATVWRGGGHIASSAATVALIAEADEQARARARFDLGQVTMSIMIAAASLGIGSCHSSVGDHDLARELLGYPPDKYCAMLISLGYPAGRALAPIREPDRRPFDDVVHRGHW